MSKTRIEKINKLIQSISEEERTKLNELIEYSAILSSVCGSCSIALKNILNVATPKNELGKICQSKVGALVETIDSSVYLISNLISDEVEKRISELNTKIEDNKDGTTEETAAGSNCTCE